MGWSVKFFFLFRIYIQHSSHNSPHTHKTRGTLLTYSSSCFSLIDYNLRSLFIVDCSSPRHEMTHLNESRTSPGSSCMQDH